jgi:hypothetical protein
MAGGLQLGVQRTPLSGGVSTVIVPETKSDESHPKG